MPAFTQEQDVLLQGLENQPITDAGTPFLDPRQMQAPPPPEPIDAETFFQENPVTAADDPRFQEARDDWFEGFVDKYHDQEFQGVDDFIQFATSLQGPRGHRGGPEIQGFMQKMMKQHMPPAARREMEARQQESAAKSAALKDLNLKIFMEEEAEKRGFVLDKDGNPIRPDSSAAEAEKEKRRQTAFKEMQSLEKVVASPTTTDEVREALRPRLQEMIIDAYLTPEQAVEFRQKRVAQAVDDGGKGKKKKEGPGMFDQLVDLFKTGAGVHKRAGEKLFGRLQGASEAAGAEPVQANDPAGLFN